MALHVFVYFHDLFIVHSVSQSTYTLCLSSVLWIGQFGCPSPGFGWDWRLQAGWRQDSGLGSKNRYGLSQSKQVLRGSGSRHVRVSHPGDREYSHETAALGEVT